MYKKTLKISILIYSMKLKGYNLQNEVPFNQWCLLQYSIYSILQKSNTKYSTLSAFSNQFKAPNQQLSSYSPAHNSIRLIKEHSWLIPHLVNACLPVIQIIISLSGDARLGYTKAVICWADCVRSIWNPYQAHNFIWYTVPWRYKHSRCSHTQATCTCGLVKNKSNGRWLRHVHLLLGWAASASPCCLNMYCFAYFINSTCFFRQHLLTNTPHTSHLPRKHTRNSRLLTR